MSDRPGRHGLIFACYMDEPEYLPHLKVFIDLFEKHFADCDLHVGLNPCRLRSEARRLFAKSRLAPRVRVTPRRLVLDSDASAFQTALRDLAETGRRRELYWFCHTKGATSREYDVLRGLMIELLLRRQAIEQSFRETDIGVYAPVAARYTHGSRVVSRYMRFPRKPLHLACLYSFYVLRGDLLWNFLDNCDRSFFEEPLPTRYFFEGDFPQIAFMQGHPPLVRQVAQLPVGRGSELLSTRETVDEEIGRWMLENAKNASGGGGE